MKLKHLLNEKGQTIVEFAVILPVLLTILCGIMDYGWIYLNRYETDHAAFEAARYLSMYGYTAESSSDDVKNTIIANANSVIASNVRFEDADADGNTYTATIEFDQYTAVITLKKPVRMLTFVGGAIYGKQYIATSQAMAPVIPLTINGAVAEMGMQGTAELSSTNTSPTITSGG